MSHVASNMAAILTIQKLETQLDAIHLAPSGLRDAAIQIITEGIGEVRAGDAQAFDSYTESARIKWLGKLGNWYTGFDNLPASDQRICTDAYLRGDWHAASSRIIRLLVSRTIVPMADEPQDCDQRAQHTSGLEGEPVTEASNTSPIPMDELDDMIDQANEFASTLRMARSPDQRTAAPTCRYSHRGRSSSLR